MHTINDVFVVGGRHAQKHNTTHTHGRTDTDTETLAEKCFIVISDDFIFVVWASINKTFLFGRG